MHRLVIVSVLAIALAGCAKDGGAAAEDSADDAVVNQHLMHNVTFVDAVRAVTETYSGNFPITDGDVSVVPVDVEVNDPERRHDITSLLGPGHNFVVVEIVGVTNDFDVSLRPEEQGALWTYERPDAMRLESTVVTSQRVDLVVWFVGTAPNDVAEHADGAEYEITVTVEQDPARIPSGIAFEVVLGSPGDHVMLEGQGGRVPDVLVFDPSDRLVGVWPSDDQIMVELDANMTPGPYVFLPQGHGAFFSLRLGMNDPDERPRARLVQQEVTFGEMEAMSTAETHDLSWSLDVPRHAIQAGLCVFGGEGAGSNIWATLAGPDGEELVQVALNGVVEPLPGGCAFSTMGDPRFAPGAYSVEYTDAGSHGVQVQDFMIYYRR